MPSRGSALLLPVLVFWLWSASVSAQNATTSRNDPLALTTAGIYNWVHTSGDIQAAYEFYNDVFEIDLAPSPFYGDPAVQPTEIRPVSQAGSDALVWDLTNTAGSRYRSAFLSAPNTAFGLELVEFLDIPRESRHANAWDPGTSILIFEVRDLDAVIERARAHDAPIVSAGGDAVMTSKGQAVVMRNPDGYLMQAIQAAPDVVASAQQPGEVIRTSIGITVADTDRSLAFYRDLLDWEIGTAAEAADADLRLYGLRGGTLSLTRMTIPGTAASVVLHEFDLRPDSTHTANPFEWRIQDINAPQFQLQVRGLNELLQRTRMAGYRFLSVGGRPIERPFGRFVFVIDPDNVLVEYVEAADDR